ncbi:MAG: nucleoside-diphosphate sugar epimerase, partial [Lysobacteraceae bacterium]
MRGKLLDSRQICAITDGRAGNARQAEALAGALANTEDALRPSAIALRPRAPWRWWAPRRLPGDAAAFGTSFATLLDRPPAIAVGCGRQAALATRLLRARGAKTVQILDPRLDPSHWDLLIVPEHDGVRGANVLTTVGSLHPVDDAWLIAARMRFPQFADLPRPRIAMLLGGRSAHARFDRMGFEVMAAKLEAVLAREGGSVLVTISRRSDALMRKALAHRYD